MYVLLAQTIYTVQVPSVTVVLERKRTEFYLSRLQLNQAEQKHCKLFEIGSQDDPQSRTYTAETLGFSECYF